MSREAVGYRRVRLNAWTLWVEPRWREEWWEEIQRRLSEPGALVSKSRHACTVRIALPGAGSPRAPAYLKIYSPPTGWNAVKDLWRLSKARRSLLVSAILAEQGFRVVPVLAAGEWRRSGRLRRAFLLTRAVEAPTLVQLAEQLVSESGGGKASRRSAIARRIGTVVGRFHELGWVHGDLVATNLLVAADGDAVYLLDHDRSGRWRGPGRMREQRRNLIQLNRLVLDGVRHSDRMRVFRAYAGERGWDRARRRREARLLAQQTLVRRARVQRLRAARAAGA